MQSIMLFLLIWGTVISGEYTSTAPGQISYNFRKDGAVIVKLRNQGRDMSVEGKWEVIPPKVLKEVAAEFPKGPDTPSPAQLRIDAMLRSERAIILSFGKNDLLNDYIYEVEGGDWVFFNTGFRLIKS